MKIVVSLLAVAVVAIAGALVAVAIWAPWRQDANSYQPRLEQDPSPPAPPAWAQRDFAAFLERLRQAGTAGRSALVLHGAGLTRAEAVFRGTAGVLPEAQIEMHAPFFAVDPEAIFARYADLPTLERGLAQFQQNCSGCHGPY